MSTHQVLSLPSNSSMTYYPNNTMSQFKVELATPLTLVEPHEVGLAGLHYTRSWYNFSTAEVFNVRYDLEGDLGEETPAMSGDDDDDADDEEEEEASSRRSARSPISYRSYSLHLESGHYLDIWQVLKQLNLKRAPVEWIYSEVSHKVSLIWREPGWTVLLNVPVARKLGWPGRVLLRRPVHSPKSSLDGEGPLEFEVISSGNDWLDLSECYLNIKWKIRKHDRSQLKYWNTAREHNPPDMYNQPVNLALHSMFRQVDLIMNERLVYSLGDNYPNRAYVTTLSSYSEKSKKTWLCQLEGWYWDDATEYEATSNRAHEMKAKDMWNNGGGKSTQLRGRLHLGLVHQGRLIPNNVNVRLILTRSRQEFFMMSWASGQKPFQITIESATLDVRRVKLAPSEQLLLERVLASSSGALYPLTHVVVKNFTLSSGISTAEIDAGDGVAYLTPRRFGTVKANLRFKTGLSKMVTLLAFATFDNTIMTATALTGTATTFGHPPGCIPAWLVCIPCYTTACSIRDLSVYCVVYMPCSMHVDEAEAIQLWRICLNTTSMATTIRSALIFASPSTAHYEWRC